MEELYDIKAASRFVSFRKEYISPSQNKAAAILQINQGTLSKMERGMLKIPFDLVSRLAKEYHLNTEWLAKGTGGKLDKNPPKQKLLTDINALNAEMENLKKAIKIMELNQSHLMKIIERQDKVLERLQKEFDNK
ncbi:hypothetical protein A0256_23445 [Mucilaginibacter sp. PAMC 26640]|nr:hypothetical protein A0256_23445 [Mucilaginibacter sp. PAMC 26640]